MVSLALIIGLFCLSFAPARARIRGDDDPGAPLPSEDFALGSRRAIMREEVAVVRSGTSDNIPTTATADSMAARRRHIIERTPSPVNVPPSWSTNSPSVAPSTTLPTVVSPTQVPLTLEPTIPSISIPISPITISFVTQDKESVALTLVEQQLGAFAVHIIGQGMVDQGYDETYQHCLVQVNATLFRRRGRLLKEGSVATEVQATAYFEQEPHPTSDELSNMIEQYFVVGTGYQDLEKTLEASGITNVTDLQVSFLSPVGVGEAPGSPQGVDDDDATGDTDSGRGNAALAGGLVAMSLILAGAMGGSMVSCWIVRRRQQEMKSMYLCNE